MKEFIGSTIFDDREVMIYLLKEKHGFYVMDEKREFLDWSNWFVTKKAALEYCKYLKVNEVNEIDKND